MFIKDIFILKESNPVEVNVHEEITINLELEKVPPCYHTLLIGKVFYKCSPIKNATVMVLDENFNSISSTLTDENGIYTFSNILKPGKYKVIVSAIGYNTSNVKSVCISEKTITRLSFRMKKSLIFVNGIVYGKVLESESRKPIENATIYLKSLEYDCKVIYNTTSNNSGQYLIYNILPNKYKMIVKKDGYIIIKPLEITVEKYDRIPLYFDLIRKPNYCKNTISGNVTFEGKQISGVAVFLYSLDKQGNEKLIQIQETNKKGIFMFSNVESGNYIVKGKLQNSLVYENFFTVK